MAPDKKKTIKSTNQKCQECWGIHPQHRCYCSWSAGSKLAKANIVAPDYHHPKDVKVQVNGGYVGVARHVGDVWGTSKTTAKDEAPSKETEAKQAKADFEDEWEKVEGEWVEI